MKHLHLGDLETDAGSLTVDHSKMIFSDTQVRKVKIQSQSRKAAWQLRAFPAVLETLGSVPIRFTASIDFSSREDLKVGS